MRCECMGGWEAFSSQRAGPVADLVGGLKRHPGSVEEQAQHAGLKEARQRRVAEGAVAEELVGRPADEDVLLSHALDRTVAGGRLDLVIPLVAAAIAVAAFLTRQARSAHPLLPLRILASRNRGGAYASIALAMFANYGAFLFPTYTLQGVEHLSPLAAGLGFLPLTVINGLASTQVASRLLGRIPVRAIVVPGLLIGAAGAALFTQITPGSGYAGLVLPGELLIGLGLGLSVMPLFATATREADPADAGATGAAANMAQQVGASVGTAVLNTIAATATASYAVSHRGLASAAAAAVSHGYSVASVWAAAVLVLAALIGGALITTRPGRTR
jgi:hypothetical protein